MQTSYLLIPIIELRTLIRIRCPLQNEAELVSRKGFYALNVQVIYIVIILLNTYLKLSLSLSLSQFLRYLYEIEFISILPYSHPNIIKSSLNENEL